MRDLCDLFGNGMYFCFACGQWVEVLESFMIDENSANVKIACGHETILRIKQNKNVRLN